MQQFASPVDDTTEGHGHRLESQADPEQRFASAESLNHLDAHPGAFRGAGAG